MELLKKWRFHLTDNGEFILAGVDKYGREVHIPIQQENIQYIKLDTSYLQLNIKDRVESYLLWFKDADMSRAIAPMRAVKRQPKQSTIDAVYCMMAEVSMYLCGKSFSFTHMQHSKLQGYYLLMNVSCRCPA